MLKKITINQNFIKKDRILNGNFKDQFELTFKKGINVLTAPNGSGKTTIMNSINNVMLKNKPEDGFDVETFYEEDDKPKPWFIFSMNNMTAQEQISQISPFDEETYADKIAFWQNRIQLSHGQQMKEVLLDIEELAQVPDMIFIDEPEIALDFLSIIEFIDILKQIKDTQIILISHHPLFIFNEDFNIVDFCEKNDSYLDLLKKELIIFH